MISDNIWLVRAMYKYYHNDQLQIIVINPVTSGVIAKNIKYGIIFIKRICQKISVWLSVAYYTMSPIWWDTID